MTTTRLPNQSPLQVFIEFVAALDPAEDYSRYFDFSGRDADAMELPTSTPLANCVPSGSAEFCLRLKNAIVHNLVANPKFGEIPQSWLRSLANVLRDCDYARLPDRASLTLLLHATKVGLQSPIHRLRDLKFLCIFLG